MNDDHEDHNDNDDFELPPPDPEALTQGSKSRMQKAETQLGEDGGTENLDHRIKASLDATPDGPTGPGGEEADPFIGWGS